MNPKITHRKYLYGDFDRDRVRNIDDPYPYNSMIKKWPEDNKTFWHRAQYGGGEIKLSTALRSVEKMNNSRIPGMKKFLRENQDSTGRIKTIPSTIMKLNERYNNSLGDVAGVRILVENRKLAYAREKELHRKYSYDRNSRDDYYKNPKNNSYYALHNTFLFFGKKLEGQIVSKKMSRLNEIQHKVYKRKGDLSPYIKKARRLFELGY